MYGSTFFTGRSAARLAAAVFFALAGAAFPLPAAQISKVKVFEAVDRNDIETVRKAINGGFDVNATQEDGETLLGWAIRCDLEKHPRREIIRLIAQSPKLQVNQLSQYEAGQEIIKETALIAAATKGMTEIVGILLKKGADINARRNVSGTLTFTALMAAAGGGHLETVRLLLAYRPNLFFADAKNRTALEFAIKWENLEMVKLIHAAGISLNRLIDEGNSILTLCFYHEKFDVLDYLVARGADVNLAGPRGYTVLMHAFVNKHEAWFTKKYKFDPLRFQKKILSLKPNLNYVNGNGTALHQAAISGSVDRVKLLLDSGANIDIVDGTLRQTPLNLCVATKRIPMVKYLVQRGANTTLPDSDGETPLSRAISMRHAELIDILRKGGASFKNTKPSAASMASFLEACGDPNPLDHGKNMGILKDTLDNGASPDYQSATGKTGLMALAAEKHYRNSHALEKAALLLKRGAKPDVADKKGQTALMIAATMGNLELVKLLVANGASVHVKDASGLAAISYASRSGNDGVVSYLKSKGAKPGAGDSSKNTIVPELLGTWQGKNYRQPQIIYILVLRADNRFEFQSRNLSNAVLSQQAGTYTVQKDSLVLMVPGYPPLVRKWLLSNGLLGLDKIIQLQKID